MEKGQMDFPALVEETIRAKRGGLHSSGALMVDTGRWTGRAVEARRIVDRPEIHSQIAWGKVNKAITPDEVDRVFERLGSRLEQGPSYFMRGFVGPFPIEVRSSSAWHAAFAKTLFRSSRVGIFAGWQDQEPIRIYHEPDLTTRELGVDIGMDTVVALDFVQRRVVIVGTAYAGEIKKSAFSMANFLLPQMGILPMHASANTMSSGNESCLLFGLSGTGKTTLSADPERALIGDDEIIWSTTGISNLEGGCYAKLINLNERSEPDIWHAVHRFGAIMENVACRPGTGEIDFDDSMRTENTRAAYPLSHIHNLYRQDVEAQSPKTIVFLTADAFGALPAVARLDSWQAQYHFVSGYTAKVAGTELGVKEPSATFSQCFGGPFMPRPASVYARMLAAKAAETGAQFWLLNTGWTNGGYGKGPRFPIETTRTILHAIQGGRLNQIPTRKHPVFGFEVPLQIPGVDPKWLAIPEGPAVQSLAQRFDVNAENLASEFDPAVRAKGGPQITSSSNRSGLTAVL